jgi:DNA modification methylase
MGDSTVHVGDARDIPLPDGSVQCCVTSPPYYGLRDYGVDGQIGSEPSLAEFLSTMVDVMREVRRVLRDDGTVFLNLGDSYAGGHKQQTTRQRWQHSAAKGVVPKDYDEKEAHRVLGHDFRPKCKMLVPHRLAIALCDDGWILRQDIVWFKGSPMPESVTDRPTTAHEFLFLLAKNPRYYYDAEAVREVDTGRASGNGFKREHHLSYGGRGQDEQWVGGAGRNKRSVWAVNSEPFPQAHFATFPKALVSPCLKAGTAQKVCPHCGAQWVREMARASEKHWTERNRPGRKYGIGGRHGRGDGRTEFLERATGPAGWHPGCDCPDNDGSGKALVLDPFCGSGTTGVVARQMGRSFFGVELNPEYAEMARKRISVEGEGRDVTTDAEGRAIEQLVLSI